MAAYSTQLLASSISGGGTLTVTPPSGKVWVVRDISGCMTTVGVNDGFTLLVAGVGLALVPVYFFRWKAPPGSLPGFQWSGRVVIPPGWELQAEAVSDPANAADIYVSGYQL